MLLGHSIKLILLRVIRRNRKCIDTRNLTDGCTDKVIMNHAFTFFCRSVSGTCWTGVLTWLTLYAWCGGFIFLVNLAGLLHSRGYWGPPCCDCLWWVEEMSLVTFASLFYGSVKDVAFNKSAVRI